MTATEELRHLLDERGVEHWDTVGITEYRGENDRTVRCYARPEPITLDVAIIAAPPEQAVEATLGRGECHIVASATEGLTGSEPQKFIRFSCGHWVWMHNFEQPKFCPECGRKVVTS